jgi:thiamine-phosphate pyrophosphorylase
MKKHIERLQYISQGEHGQAHLEAVISAYEAGCKWVQLRMKQVTTEALLNIATQAKKWSNQKSSRIIINDFPAIAKAVQADGVHLGLMDMAHAQARAILGEGVIIGGTANTIDDIRKYAAKEVVDYIGLGPFRFTTTKKQLSPILGIAGYQRIMDFCHAENINIPIIAIGGIELEDIPMIMSTGVYGIAVSGLITKAAKKDELIKTLLDMIHLSVEHR